jgi:cation diffusion facilitator family transporter
MTGTCDNEAAMAASGGTRAIIAAFCANLGIAIAKFTAFAFTGSSSMLAEGIHSVADTGNQALLLHGTRVAGRPASDRFQFGFGRARYFWSFVVAVVLFSLGSLFAVFEGVEKILHPHELESAAWAIGVLLFAMVVEGWSFRTAVTESNHIRGEGQGWWTFVRRTRVPELVVVLLEDFGALIGLTFALVAVSLSVVLDEPVLDGVGTLAIGLLLGAIAIVLAVEMKNSLLGESATVENEAEIRSAIDGSPDVRRLIHLRTQHIGPEEILVAAKVDFDVGLSVPALADAIDACEARIRAAVPQATLIYLEPDLYEAARSAEP